MGKEVIHQESWYKESSGLEKELARLRRSLFEGQISDLEYARAVIRLHPESKTLLHRENNSLWITAEWVNVHREEIQEIQKLANEAMQILLMNGPRVPRRFERGLPFEQVLLIDPADRDIIPEEDALAEELAGAGVDLSEGNNLDFCLKALEEFEWRDTSYYRESYVLLYRIRDEYYTMGHIALRPSAISDYPDASNFFFRAADSEEQINDSLPRVKEMLTKFLERLQRCLS